MTTPRVRFFCNSVKLVLTVILGTSSVCAINKCCPENHVLNSQFSCVDVQSVGSVSTLNEEWRNWTTEQSFKVTSILLPCHWNFADINHFNHIKLLGNGKLLLKKESVLSEADYCIDFYADSKSASKLFKIVYFCPCVNLLCIWKCCVPGNKLNFTEKHNSIEVGCIQDSVSHEASIEWNINKINISIVPEYVKTKYLMKRCEAPKSLSVKLEGKHKYSLQKNGSIISYDYAVEIGKFDYCGDIEITAAGTYEPVVIVCMQPTPVKKKHLVDGILNSIGSFFLFLTILLHIWLPELHSLPGKCLTCHASSLLMALICISINQLFITSPSPKDIGCCILGFFTQFSYQSSFFWLSVICVRLSIKLAGMKKGLWIQHRSENKQFVWNCVFSWGGAMLVTIVTLLMEYGSCFSDDSDYKPNIGKTRCWFNGDLTLALYFYLPLTILMTINVLTFIFTISVIISWSKDSRVLKQADGCKNDSTTSTQRRRFIVYMKIFCHVGLFYVMEIVSWLVGGPEAIWYLTDAINSLRGLLIFIIFCCKPKVWKGIQRKTSWFNNFMEKCKKNTEPNNAGIKLNETPDQLRSQEAVETPLEENNKIVFL